MKRILVTGALGQIGSELVARLRQDYGADNVIETDIHAPTQTSDSPTGGSGPFELLDVTDGQRMAELVDKHQVDTIIHLAALLSVTAEKNPLLAWNLNMGGLMNALEVARQFGCQVFYPSSIAAFGPLTPRFQTPQDTIQRPTTMYGINKVAGELLCDYYFRKYGVDARGVRFPGLISHKTPPGGGTTDYAVEIYYEAVRTGRYVCPIAKGTYMDMMYMEDAITAVIDLMEADGSRLKHRNAFNISAMSVDPEMIRSAIQTWIPTFEMAYEVDSEKQSIADSWPDAIDSSAAHEEWGFRARYNLDATTREMIVHLRKKFAVI
ncbi:NAD-dependent epimerase/dehydratase family protein [Alicyclobacillus acidiphilus]|uniref:NAD-dependent epimerase/dehydratase family protein n=1 Tax=Alicyclobacillus acidiphilus TaxID=182455 RepID=UPI00082D590C|nr:NAD-dependent epimerase/dehydratase family protein [Alicyclobacillus acidiphilus]